MDRLVGTHAYDNWRAYREGKPIIVSFEYIFYSDALLNGDITTGLDPCQFFNLTLPSVRVGEVRPAVALRLGLYIGFIAPSFDKTDASRYHGGSIADEIGALASLLVGVRIRAGGRTRWFDDAEDPKGRPIAWDLQAYHALNVGPEGFVLPGVSSLHSLEPLRGIKSYVDLSPEQAIALTKAARLYQEALWLAESEPNLAWLLFVSAIETAATFWDNSKVSPLDRLKASRPKFVTYLQNTNIPDLSTRVAEEFKESIGSAKKFIDFLITFLPPPPIKRPGEWGQVIWDQNNLSKIFRMIYKYRSEALHDGRPFPAPMCEPPFKHETWDAVAERPGATAVSVHGNTWLVKDTPMLLHTFEYIVRNALNSWWDSMLGKGQPAAKDI